MSEESVLEWLERTSLENEKLTVTEIGVLSLIHKAVSLFPNKGKADRREAVEAINNLDDEGKETFLNVLKKETIYKRSQFKLEGLSEDLKKKLTNNFINDEGEYLHTLFANTVDLLETGYVEGFLLEEDAKSDSKFSYHLMRNLLIMTDHHDEMYDEIKKPLRDVNTNVEEAKKYLFKHSREQGNKKNLDTPTR